MFLMCCKNVEVSFIQKIFVLDFKKQTIKQVMCFLFILLMRLLKESKLCILCNGINIIHITLSYFVYVEAHLAIIISRLLESVCLCTIGIHLSTLLVI